VEVDERNGDRVGLVDRVSEVSNNEVGPFIGDNNRPSKKPKRLPVDTGKLLDIGGITENLSAEFGIDDTAQSLLEKSDGRRVGGSSQRKTLNVARLATTEG
jgi:hypothetical protein